MKQQRPHVHKDAEVPHTHDEHGEAVPMPLDPGAAIRNDGPPVDAFRPQPQSNIPSGLDPVLAAGQAQFLAQEVVGTWVALAEARGVPAQQFLAERCSILIQRLGMAESELALVTNTGRALNAELETLRAKDCHCDDEEPPQTPDAPQTPTGPDEPEQDPDVTNSGDA